MNQPVLTLLIELIMVGVVTFVAGWTFGRERQHPIDIKDIDGYLKDNFPTQWDAYHRGIKEGYDQGLRDCGKDPT